MRRDGVTIFFFGVAFAVAFGCLVAAFDIWGGIPRGARPVAHALSFVAVVCIVVGAFRWVRSWPAEQRPRAVLKAAVVLALTAALLGGGLFAYYAHRWEVSERICAPALIAPTRAEREAALRDGLGPLFPVIDPHSSCIQLERDRLEFERTGYCPTFPMDDVPCKCGDEKWTGKDSPKRCADLPTSCEWRPDRDGEKDHRRRIGCPDPKNWTLEDARQLKKE